MEAAVDCMEALITIWQLRLVGHLSRIGDDRRPKAILFRNPKEGRRNRVSPSQVL